MRSSIASRRISGAFGRATAALAATATAGLLLSACSGGSGGGDSAPSQADILKKLKSDSTISGQLGQLSSNSKIKNEAYTCVAKVIHDDVDTSDQTAYVNGDKSVKELGKGTSDSELTSDLRQCLTAKIKNGS